MSILSSSTISYIQRRWHGPAITVLVGEDSWQLGEGAAEATLRINDAKILRSMRHSLSLMFGEGYINGRIEVEGNLMAVLQGFYQSGSTVPGVVKAYRFLLGHLPIGIARAEQNAQHHYDIGNDFYKLWLDKSRTYSCAYFLNRRDSIETAQWQKNELLCRKLRLEPEMSVVDIGSGWGGFVFHAAERYQASVTAITPAKEQADYIKGEAKKRGLADKISVINADWRSLSGSFDRVVSVGMFEHVGWRQYDAYFQKWTSLLKENGISLLHTIGRTLPGPPDPFINKYIFPGGYLPTLVDIIGAAAKNGLPVIDVENLRRHYALTLAAWAQNFVVAKSEVIKMFDENFARMWWLYLQASEAGFRYGDLQLYQVVMPGPSADWPLNREMGVDDMAARSYLDSRA